MRRARAVGVVCALLLVAALTACQSSRTGEDRLDDPSPSAATPTGHGKVFLDVGECSTAGKDFREISCRSERAEAKVTARHRGRESDGPLCPARTDFVLHVTENRPAVDEDGDGSVPRGYACMRHLQAPHPGDPGGGGGPRTIVGDCVYRSKAGEVRETPCAGRTLRPDARRDHADGKDVPANAPEFRVGSAVAERAQCPPSTVLYVRLRGPEPVGCAQAVG
ncbi:hypothetical protein DY218_11140 [Streptomyces triticagri]|uniref:Lipoprotein n=1 Tax=Streptomyces triticagri TaxID=2293568 RepID=A0A372M748_9ACTN|nr:hypothetical protein [Streptomyces triticagri]RFU86681.1 hypothetical protein DY218_11140 [Streptomyces triticagri]